MARKPISKKVRFDVFKRDLFICQYCSAKSPDVPLEIDHIIPISKNGTNAIENLITACFDCNRGKSNGLLESVPHKTAERLERMKIAQEQYKYFLKHLKIQEKIIEDAINQVQEVFRRFYDEYVFSNTFRISVKKFIKNLGVNVVKDAMETACVKNLPMEQTSKYFCGICWAKIRENG